MENENWMVAFPPPFFSHRVLGGLGFDAPVLDSRRSWDDADQGGVLRTMLWSSQDISQHPL